MSNIKEIYKTKQYKEVYREDYSEAYALDTLLHESTALLVEDNNRFEAGLEDKGRFTICVNGKAIEFMLGGPQYAALYEFICHIADENLYRVDTDGVYGKL